MSNRPSSPLTPPISPTPAYSPYPARDMTSPAVDYRREYYANNSTPYDSMMLSMITDMLPASNTYHASYNSTSGYPIGLQSTQLLTPVDYAYASQVPWQQGPLRALSPTGSRDTWYNTSMPMPTDYVQQHCRTRSETRQSPVGVFPRTMRFYGQGENEEAPAQIQRES